jgi:uncharacterized SAM-binding protein YcdF (DUF218 family)
VKATVSDECVGRAVITLMLFFLRKLIEALLLPIGISAFLTIAGVLLRRRRIAISGAVVLYLFSTGFVGRLLLQPLERYYAPVTVDASPQADAIVVLSGAVVRGVNAPGVQWGDNANRYFAGFDLAKAGKAKTIIFTAATTGTSGATQGAIMRDVAIRDGIQPERIIVTPLVLTTDDEARTVSRIPNIHSILLVTSGSHLPRAAMLFRAQGLNVTPFPTDQRFPGQWRIGASSFIPESGQLRLSELALREYYGLAVYRLIAIFHAI